MIRQLLKSVMEKIGPEKCRSCGEPNANIGDSGLCSECNQNYDAGGNK